MEHVSKMDIYCTKTQVVTEDGSASTRVLYMLRTMLPLGSESQEHIVSSSILLKTL